MPKVTKMLDAAFRTGISSKTGKPWSLAKVEVDDKTEATGFSLNVGDEVELKYSEQYKNYTAEKNTPAKQEKQEIVAKLDEILSILKAGSSGKVDVGSTLHQPSNSIKDSKTPSAPADLPPVDQLEPPF